MPKLTLFLCLIGALAIKTTNGVGKIALDFSIATCAGDTWVRSDNSYVSGGTIVALVNTLEGCLAECVRNKGTNGVNACMGVQVNSMKDPIQCRIFKTPSAFDNSVTSQGFVQYFLSRRCESAPASQTDCHTSGRVHPSSASLTARSFLAAALSSTRTPAWQPVSTVWAVWWLMYEVSHQQQGSSVSCILRTTDLSSNHRPPTATLPVTGLCRDAETDSCRLELEAV